MTKKKKPKTKRQLEEQIDQEKRIADYELSQLYYKLEGEKKKNSSNIGFLALVIFCLVVILIGWA
jgi:hypothetical protein